MGIRTICAVLAAKAVSAACRLAGKQGVTMAGRIARKIDPDILRTLAAQVKGDIFVVCGTNGKTTTNNLLCSVLESGGKKVVCNHTGSNMLDGVTAAFVLAAGPGGTIHADCASIEIDEASTVRVLPFFSPDYMILTNIFRDQLDRYGEIDSTMDLLKQAMKLAPKMKLIVNADDSLCSYLAMESGNPYVTFGISQKVFDQTDSHEIREGRFCKCCGERLDYAFYHYSQMGMYRCPSCGFSRPHPEYDISDVFMENGLSFCINGKRIHADYHGFYNIYNIAAVYSALRESGMSVKQLDHVLETFHPQNGRMEEFDKHGTHIVLNLAKNPAGFNQNISAVMEDPGDKDIIIVINDNAQDGTDISWLWDVDFDRMKEEHVRSITVSGIRCQDMRLRLKYVDIPSALIPDVETAIRTRIRDGCKNLYVLVNYTALYSTREFLAKL